MSREAFEADAAAYGFDLTRFECAAPEPWSEYKDEATGHRWAGWQAARAAALEEAAEVCERIGPAMAERYGPGAECITTSDECAEAIRALKGKE